jgi:hypothetical protein
MGNEVDNDGDDVTGDDNDNGDHDGDGGGDGVMGSGGATYPVRFWQATTTTTSMATGRRATKSTMMATA